MGCRREHALVLLLSREELVEKLGRNRGALGVLLLGLHVGELLLERRGEIRLGLLGCLPLVHRGGSLRLVLVRLARLPVALVALEMGLVLGLHGSGLLMLHLRRAKVMRREDVLGQFEGGLLGCLRHLLREALVVGQKHVLWTSFLTWQTAELSLLLHLLRVERVLRLD